MNSMNNIIVDPNSDEYNYTEYTPMHDDEDEADDHLIQEGDEVERIIEPAIKYVFLFEITSFNFASIEGQQWRSKRFTAVQLGSLTVLELIMKVWVLLLLENVSKHVSNYFF